jgi:hypothetical protein
VRVALKYVELKSDRNDAGPAWIGRVTLSKTGRTVYFNGKALKRGNGVGANHFDLETGEWYWISGVKKRGSNRHWAGSGKIQVEAAAVSELLEHLGVSKLDETLFVVSHSVQPTDLTKFLHLENQSFPDQSYKRL